MSERNSWAVGSDTDRRVSVEDARIAIGALWAPDGSNINTRPGFRPGPGTPGLVTASTPTADVNVHVAAFQYVLPASRGTGPYIVSLDASKTVDVLTSSPADASNPRVDLIVAQQSDAFYGDSGSGFLVRHVVGTPSATPADPTVDGSPDYVPLARITVAANATAITGADVEDLRPVPLYTVAAGGVLPIDSLAQRDNIASPYPGQTIYRTDWGWIEVYDGSAWRVRSTATASSMSALVTGVTDPYQGQLALTRDDNRSHLYDGTGWVAVGGGGLITQVHQTASQQDLPSDTDTPITWDSADYTDNGTYSGSIVTLTRSGRFRIDGMVCFWAGADSTKSCIVRIDRNGVTLPSSSRYRPATNGHTTELDTSVVVACSAGDEIQLIADQDTGSLGHTATGSDEINPVMTITYLGPA